LVPGGRNKAGGEFYENSPPFSFWASSPYHGEQMIWHVDAELNNIAAQGRDYPWERPKCCLGCGGPKVWGHGFAERQFEGFDQTVPLKCYRCPGCGCVITLRPRGYFRRIRSAVASIRSELEHRLEKGRWRESRPNMSRFRHWLGNLRRQALAGLGWQEEQGLAAAFDRLLKAGVVPVGRTIHTENHIGSDPPQ